MTLERDRSGGEVSPQDWSNCVIPARDKPGENIALHPQALPRWLGDVAGIATLAPELRTAQELRARARDDARDAFDTGAVHAGTERTAPGFDAGKQITRAAGAGVAGAAETTREGAARVRNAGADVAGADVAGSAETAREGAARARNAGAGVAGSAETAREDAARARNAGADAAGTAEGVLPSAAVLMLITGDRFGSESAAGGNAQARARLDSAPRVSDTSGGNVLGGAGLPVEASRSGEAALGAGLPGDAPPPDAAVLLTHRSPRMRSHSGQIAFPGGAIDPGDRNPVDAALREAWEETGLDRRLVTPVAQLEPAFVRRRGRLVIPVLAHAARPVPVAVTSELEADEVFYEPLARLLARENRIVVKRGAWSGPAFWARGYLVWGFTGALLAGLARHAGWVESWHDVPRWDLETAIRHSRNGEKARAAK